MEPELERAFGWFECRECQHFWKSAWTWCVKGTRIVYYRQDCRECGFAKMPYKSDYLRCAECGYYCHDCECDDGDFAARTDGHMKEHCHRCKDEDWSCSDPNYGGDDMDCDSDYGGDDNDDDYYGGDGRGYNWQPEVADNYDSDDCSDDESSYY